MKQNALRVGLVGFGYWGPNLLRNLTGHPRVQVLGVVEPSPRNQAACASRYPHIPLFGDLNSMLDATDIDAVVIATPPGTHCELAVCAIERGCHVLVEKPLAVSVAECDEILAAAAKHDRMVMVDHTFVYNPAVTRLAHEVESGQLGKLLYYDSTRVNLGGFQDQVNVLWDLAPHDLSILDYLTGGATPASVTAIGVKQFNSAVENLCYVTLQYANGFLAHLHLNWAAPIKLRTVLLGGDRKMAIYDDNNPSEKLRIYDKGVAIENGAEDQLRVNYRVGDMLAPALVSTEALALMIAHFVDCVQTGQTPRSDGLAGKRVLEILEAASISLQHGGRPQPIGPVAGTTATTSASIEDSTAQAQQPAIQVTTAS